MSWSKSGVKIPLQSRPGKNLQERQRALSEKERKRSDGRIEEKVGPRLHKTSLGVDFFSTEKTATNLVLQSKFVRPIRDKNGPVLLLW